MPFSEKGSEAVVLLVQPPTYNSPPFPPGDDNVLSAVTPSPLRSSPLQAPAPCGGPTLPATVPSRPIPSYPLCPISERWCFLLPSQTPRLGCHLPQGSAAPFLLGDLIGSQGFTYLQSTLQVSIWISSPDLFPEDQTQSCCFISNLTGSKHASCFTPNGSPPFSFFQ